jgi:hypothetical protein
VGLELTSDAAYVFRVSSFGVIPPLVYISRSRTTSTCFTGYVLCIPLLIGIDLTGEPDQPEVEAPFENRAILLAGVHTLSLPISASTISSAYLVIYG